MGKHENRIVLFAVSVGLALAGSVCADDNVRAVQEKLRDGGFYSGEIDGAYSSQLAAALTRFQVRKGLPVTGQLDVETGNALDAKPAVTKDTAAPEQSSETWRRLRRREQQTTSTVARERSSPHTDRSDPDVGPAQSGAVATSVTSEPAAQSAGSPVPAVPISGAKPARALPAAARTSAETTEPASAPPATTPADEFSTERLRDYVGAFVLAGLDPHIGSEADFFADRVKYYDQGVIDREKIRNDLQDYAAHWPQRRFWFVGNIKIEPQHRKRVRVTFPLRYELRNGATYSSGTINKILVLEPAGDDLQIVEVNETKAE
jgi:peptidoglycan hydrolase-like protein with peptidoglycan-binding domain